jgi:uncharacterized phage protein (TIGR02218 family)
MSKDVPSSLLTHYALGSTTVAHALFIEREDGETFGFTDHDANDEIDGFVYQCDDPGLTLNEFVIAAGCDVGNTEVRVLQSYEVFTELDLIEHKWRNARFLLFRYNHQQSPAITDIDECLAGVFGEIEYGEAELKIELHDLRRFLNHPVGSARSKTCRYRLGSTSMGTGGLCMKDISAPPFTFPFEVTHQGANTRLSFRDDTLAHAADWVGEGSVTFDSGVLAGITKKVHAYDANGTFHMYLPAALPIEVGVTGTAVVGCRHRRTEDCFTKFENVVNFGGEPDARAPDTLTRPATADA